MKPFWLLLLAVCANAQDSTNLLGPANGWLNQATKLSALQSTERNLADGRIQSLRDVDVDAIPFFTTPEGRKVILLQIDGNTTAGMKLHIEKMHLPEGAQMYLYGYDSKGQVNQIRGPYTATGPMNSGEFWSLPIAGNTAIVELQLNEEISELPIAIREVALLDSIEEQPSEKSASLEVQTRTSIYRGAAVEHQVIDGMAIFEGDILLGRADELERYNSKEGARQSIIINGANYRWPSGKVPYTIDSTMPNQSRITAAVAHWNQKLAGSIQLVPRANEQYYVNFVNAPPSTCSSYIGYIRIAAQPINIGSMCSSGNAIHEIGHALGLFHEQSRGDRDTYITIVTANIDPSMLSNFAKATGATDSGSYDYTSIMHYPAYAFSINGQPTIITKPVGVAIGQRDTLSTGDVAGAKAMYSAATTTPTGPTTIKITFASNPTAMSLKIDGATVKTPIVMTWNIGSSHTVAALNTLDNAGTTGYAFAKWSDNGAASHTVTAPSADATITATFNNYYKLTETASPATAGKILINPATTDGLYPSDYSVQVLAQPSSGQCLKAWAGVLPVTDLLVIATMTNPTAITATFQQGAVTGPVSVPATAAGSTINIPMTATSGCIWHAYSLSSFLTIAAPTGASSGTLRVAVAPNAGVARAGYVQVNNSIVQIKQAGR